MVDHGNKQSAAADTGLDRRRNKSHLLLCVQRDVAVRAVLVASTPECQALHGAVHVLAASGAKNKSKHGMNMLM